MTQVYGSEDHSRHVGAEISSIVTYYGYKGGDFRPISRRTISTSRLPSQHSRKYILRCQKANTESVPDAG